MNAIQELVKNLENPTNAWIPENPGDQLIGRLIAMDEALSSFDNRPYPVLTIETLTGDDFSKTGETITFHAMHRVAHRSIQSLRPARNDIIAIRYLGKVETKSLNDDGSAKSAYNDYVVKIIPNTNDKSETVEVKKTDKTEMQKTLDAFDPDNESSDLPF